MQTLTFQKSVPVEINSVEISALLKRMKYNERMEILMEYVDDFFDFIAKKEEIVPMTIEEYNRKLEESEIAIKEGRVYTHNQLLNEIKSWKSAKN